MDEPSKFDLDETRRSISSESASKSASPDIPFVGKGPEAALHLWRDGWYGLAAGCIILGAWGLVGGWYFGLPLGGEIREDPFEGGWRFANFLQTIPHPALSDTPIIPTYQLREKYQQDIKWTDDKIQPASLTPPPKSAAQLPLRLAANSPSSFLAQAQTQTPTPAKELQPWLTYDTNLRTSSRIITIPLRKSSQISNCLAIFGAAGTNRNVSCLRIPPDIPDNRPVVISRQAFPAVSPHSAVYFDAAGTPQRVTGAEQVPAAATVGLFEIDFRAEGPTDVLTATIGAESDAASAPAVIWIGSFGGAIYKVTPRTDGSVSVTAHQTPTSISADLILFVSATQGWVFTYCCGDRERNAQRPGVMTTSDGGVTWQRLWYRWLPAPWVFGAFVIGMFAFERGTRAQLALRPVAAKAHITDHGVSDDPIGLDDADALGLVPISSALSRFLRNIETKPTVTFAIAGPWGSGKTSLMNLVREDLADRGVSTVWFNAWHYQKEENLLAALLASIRAQAVAPIWTPAGVNYRIRTGLRRIARDPARTIAFVILAAFAALLFWRYGSDFLKLLQASVSSDASGRPPTKSESFTETLAAFGLSTTGLGGLLIAIKKIWDLFKPLKSLPGDLLASFSGTTKSSDLDAQLSFRYRFAEEFSIFCDVLRWPPYPGLVIFVDDLDRCGPRQTVDVLEAINFVTNAGKCFVILGFDESKVKAAVADTYKGIILKIDDVTADKDGRPSTEDLVRFASHYLEKLVHLVIPVPKSRRETVEKLLGLSPVPQPSAKERRWRRWQRKGVEFVAALVLTTVVVSGAYLVMDVLVRLSATAIAVKSEPQKAPPVGTPPTPAQGAGGAVTTPAPGAQSTANKDFVSPDKLQEDGLLSDQAWNVIPPSVLITAFILLIGLFGFQFIPRLFLIQPIVSDSPKFKNALAIWVEAISARRETPRDVKRFVNRLRFLAMRLRDFNLQAEQAGRKEPLDESKLVSFAAIEDLDPASLGGAIEALGMEKTLSSSQEQNSARHRIVTMIVNGIREFDAKFNEPLYRDPVALETYRSIAGLVEERGGQADGSESDEGNPK